MRESLRVHTFLIVTAGLVSGLSLDGCFPRKESALPSFVGRQTCAPCHEKEHRFWTGSDGTLQEFEIAYTFGVRPLQQYLVRFPRGR